MQARPGMYDIDPLHSENGRNEYLVCARAMRPAIIAVSLTFPVIKVIFDESMASDGRNHFCVLFRSILTRPN